MICAGSNANPPQIERKLRALAGGEAILFEKTEIRGLEPVYAGHVSRYGAVPATLEQTARSRRLFVAFYTDEQLRAVHETEHGNYTLSEITGIAGATVDGRAVTPLHGFLSVKGVLTLDDAPVPLESHDQRALIELLYRRAADVPGLPPLADYLRSPGLHRQALEDAIGALGLRRACRLPHRPLAVAAP